MTITHHPDISTLMSCAAGSQPEVFAAVVASHLSVCHDCAREVAKMQEIGVALFDALPPVPMGCEAPVVAARAGEADAAPEQRCGELGGEVPAPLQPLLGDCLANIPWKRVAPSVWNYQVPLSKTACGDLRLVKAAPGARLPKHGHRGSELTVVLAGSYSDEFGTFSAGDVADHDVDAVHQPVADAKTGCICLIGTDCKLAYKGFLARLLQPLFRY
jgi:putative transcriptional regulator